MQKLRNEEKSKNQNSKNQTLKSISKLQTQNSKLYSGITLIALIVTVVVLLILAGVTITIMFGENSIFDNAKEANIKAKLGELEDKAGVIYSNLVTKKYEQNSNKVITTSDIANGLREEGYEIKEKQLAENAITGIEIEELTNNKITLIPDETKELTVNAITTEGGYAYFAVIEEKNYEIKLENGKLKVNRKPQEVEGGTPTTTELEIEVLEGSTVTASKHETKEKTIVLRAGKADGETKIKVTYGGIPLEFIAVVEIKPSANAEENIEGVTFSTSYGRIDIIWLDGTSNNVTQKPNAPILSSNGESMVPIIWNAKNEVVELTPTEAKNENNEWYNYEEAEGTLDSKNSHWANAKTTNSNLTTAEESYFVWIPRYAYRITYYTNTTSTEPTGYYDGYGMWRAVDGALKCKLETQKDESGNEVKDEAGKPISLVETVDYNGKKYIVHPAFCTSYDMGGWSENLSGFWFAKFEMSGDGSTSKSLKSIPGSSAYTNQTIGTFYTNARTATYGYTGTLDTSDNNTSFMNSHMCKNSEWGAVAYLAHSKYGRNGNEIGFYQGEYITNTNQSTTGNVYGICGMKGLATEYTASWDTLSTKLSNGSSFASNRGASTKYATAYINGTETYSGSPKIYNVSKTGDAIKEISVSGSYGWFSDWTSYSNSKYPFSHRGYVYSSTEGRYAGVFCSAQRDGSSGYGFRVTLCP